MKGNPQLNKESFTFSKDSKYPYFTRTVFNNGIYGYVDYFDEDHLIKGNSLAVGMMAMQFFYMSHDFYAGQFTKTASPLFEGFDEKVALWFISWFNKSSKRYQSLLVRDFENAFYETELSVPYKEGKVAVDFIRKQVQELENERESLNNLMGGVIRSKLIKIKDLFDIHPTASYGQTNATLFAAKGNTPVIVNSSRDNGVGGWVALSPTEKGNMITYSDTTTSEAIFYQPTDFIGYSHVQGLYPHESENWNENTYLYFLSLFKKTASGRFDYATKFTRYIAMDMEVAMPVNDSNEIDYAFMETYISAIKKQTIARLIEFIKCEKEAYRIAINN